MPPAIKCVQCREPIKDAWAARIISIRSLLLSFAALMSSPAQLGPSQLQLCALRVCSVRDGSASLHRLTLGCCSKGQSVAVPGRGAGPGSEPWEWLEMNSCK